MKWIRLTFIFIIILTLSLSTYYAIYYFTSQKPLSNIKNNTIIDKFGIKEIYRSKLGGEEWFINMDDPNHDLRTDPQTTLTKNDDTEHGDISWKIQNTEVRYEVFTSSGYNAQLITTLNQTELSKKGFMQSPNDWKNVEMTGYFKINSF